MSSKQKAVLLLLILYVALVVIATSYHSKNFSSYSDSEGAAEINYMEFLFFTSVLFEGVMYWLLRQIRIGLAFVATILNLLISVMLTIAIVDQGGFEGYPHELISIFGSCYMTIFAIVVWIQTRTIFR